jgi:hypothetical protein
MMRVGVFNGLIAALSGYNPIQLDFGPCGIFGCGPDLAGPYKPPPYVDHGDMSVPVFDCCALSATCPISTSSPFQPAPEFICTTPGFTFDCSCDNFGLVHCGAGDHWCNPLGYDIALPRDLSELPSDDGSTD